MREFPLFREKLLAGGKPGSVAKHGMVDDRPVDGEGVVSFLRGGYVYFTRRELTVR